MSSKDKLLELYEGQIMDLVMMSKIELGDDVIQEIKKLKKLIKDEELRAKYPNNIEGSDGFNESIH